MMKKTKETEQNSNAKIRMLPKPSPRNIRREWVLFKICENEDSETSVPNYVKQSQLQTTNLWKIQKKKTKFIRSNRSFSF